MQTFTNDLNTNIEKKLFEIINEHFSEANLNLENWGKILDNTDSNPSVYHLLSKVRYYVAFFSPYNAINLSMVLHEHDQAVGVMPLMMHKNKNNKWILSSNGIEIVEPIFHKKVVSKSRKKIGKKVFNLILNISRELKIKRCQFVNMEYFKLSEWYVNLLELAEETFNTHHLLVDLSLSIEEIRASFRTSCKQSIKQGFREWNVQVHESVSKEKFDNFRLLHRTVAKKTTRPIQSWNIQKQEIDDGISFIVSVSDQQNSLVGVGLFNCSKTLGVYESGVYKRELFNKPLGHPVQMRAIETLKEKGLNWYELGQKFLKIDKFSPTEKELSISHFKEGFATHVIARQHLSINVPDLS